MKSSERKERSVYQLKKIGLLLAAWLFFSIGTGFAAASAKAGQGDSTAGIGFGSQGNTYFFEMKPQDDWAVGVHYFNQNSLDMTDLYGQFNLADNHFKAIIGNRIFGSTADSRVYIGASISGKLSSDWVGYTSLIGGDRFQELQLGATYKVTDHYGLNFNYRSLKYEGDKSNLDVGLVFNF
ncbi:Hypothetical protein LUCI_4432 [Lucifera butyrica]|uniref:Outer membrane protein beta-barrel domain-containing protein n=2 Tax=Lucifera butyrica TaxID=1351585 RepID=A0A498R8V9_9FIRM|nr:Hypothetical protein LUCI_4432 [Lucifera butyrica]